MTPAELAELYKADIEGVIPDLADGMEDEEQEGLRAAVYDHACDYIYDRHADGATQETVRAAAEIIATHFCGEEEA